jgi:hypothetical protein
MSAERRRGALMTPTIRRVAAVGFAVALAGLLAGAVIASRNDDGSDLAAAIEEAPLVRVADITAEDGSPGRGVFVQTTRTGHICVWEAPTATSRQRGGGCNTADDPLNGESISFTLSYDGGPAIADVRAATLFGLASAEVVRASVLMSDGTEREIRLRKANVSGVDFLAFGYRIKRADLRKGVGPTAVIARDASGAELARQLTGIGG